MAPAKLCHLSAVRLTACFLCTCPLRCGGHLTCMPLHPHAASVSEISGSTAQETLGQCESQVRCSRRSGKRKHVNLQNNQLSGIAHLFARLRNRLSKKRKPDLPEARECMWQGDLHSKDACCKNRHVARECE